MTSQALKRLLALVAVLTAGAAALGCQIEPGAVGQPTYEAEVRPILMARCIRCHGSPPLGDPHPLSTQFPGPPVATVCFDVYGDTPCADADAGAGCVVHGALFETTSKNFAKFLNMDQKVLGMPPAPAPPLTSYQKDTIINWENEATPLER